MHAQPHTFRAGDLVGGHVVLDLVNTVNARDGDPVDWLDSYPRVLEWAAFTAQFDESLLAELERINEADPGAGTLALRRFRELREAIHDVLAATIQNDDRTREDASPSRSALESRRRTRSSHDLRRPHPPRAQRGIVAARLPQPRARLARSRPAPNIPRGAHAHLCRHEVRLALHRQLQGRTAPLVRHGHMRQRGEEQTALRAETRRTEAVMEQVRRRYQRFLAMKTTKSSDDVYVATTGAGCSSAKGGVGPGQP